MMPGLWLKYAQSHTSDVLSELWLGDGDVAYEFHCSGTSPFFVSPTELLKAETAERVD